MRKVTNKRTFCSTFIYLTHHKQKESTAGLQWTLILPIDIYNISQQFLSIIASFRSIQCICSQKYISVEYVNRSFILYTQLLTYHTSCFVRKFQSKSFIHTPLNYNCKYLLNWKKTFFILHSDIISWYFKTNKYKRNLQEFVRKCNCCKSHLRTCS